MEDRQVLTTEERSEIIESIIDDIIMLKRKNINPSESSSKEGKRCTS